MNNFFQYQVSLFDVKPISILDGEMHNQLTDEIQPELKGQAYLRVQI